RNTTMDIPHGVTCPSDLFFTMLYKWKVEMVAPDGRKIEFRPAGHSDAAPGGNSAYGGYFNVHPDGSVTNSVNCAAVTTQPSGDRMTYYSSDGSGIRLTFANAEQLGFVWEMSMPDGSRVIEKVGGGQKIMDRNGNFIESAVITLPDSSQAGG